jgi:hypothetical protein
MTDLKSVAVRHAGSIPAPDTLDSNHNIYYKMKDCVKCGLSKNEDEFSKNDYDNLSSWCKSCKRERARQWYKDNKVAVNKKQQQYRKERYQWFVDYKATLKCERCNENHPAVLDFHHIDPNAKEFTVSDQVWTKKQEVVMDEIKKCIVLCSNCHRKLHWEENSLE